MDTKKEDLFASIKAVNKICKNLTCVVCTNFWSYDPLGATEQLLCNGSSFVKRIDFYQWIDFCAMDLCHKNTILTPL